MFPSRVARRVAAWIALAAMLAAALVPAASHAAAGADPFGPICSAEGVRAPAPTDPAAPAGHSLEHCVFCASHAGAWVLPPAQTPLVFTSARAPLAPAPSAVLPARPPFSAARPRGPPVVS